MLSLPPTHSPHTYVRSQCIFFLFKYLVCLSVCLSVRLLGSSCILQCVPCSVISVCSSFVSLCFCLLSVCWSLYIKNLYPKINFRRKRSRYGSYPEKELQIIIIWLCLCISLWKLELVGMLGCECYCVSSNIIQKTPISCNGKKKEDLSFTLLWFSMNFPSPPIWHQTVSVSSLSHTHNTVTHTVPPTPSPPSKENKNKSCLLLSLLLLCYLASFRSFLNRSRFCILWKK